MTSPWRSPVTALALAALAAAAATPAHASVAASPLRATLRSAADDLRACRARHALADGRYQVTLVVAADGKVREVRLVAHPGGVSPAAESCLAAAFARLRFPARYEPAARRPETRTGGGRASRVPPDLRPRRSIGTIVVSWPFVLAPAPRR